VKVKGLSANALFHFTKTANNILGIIENEFYPHYSLEDWNPLSGEMHPVAVPMVSFCDIPLSQTANHARHYGYYALGLKKEWGIKNKITPVLYTYRNSAIANPLEDIRKYFISPSPTSVDSRERILESYMKVLQFLKPYKGKKITERGYRGKTINFYDEREWRFVPNINWGKDKEFSSFMDYKVYKDINIRQHYNEKIKSKKLSFEPKDIKYIIVKKNKEVLEMTKQITGIKEDKGYSPDDLLLLSTKVISMEQIAEDF
jgi:hypothetical protein